MNPNDARGARIVESRMRENDSEKRWIVEPKSRGFDVTDTAPRSAPRLVLLLLRGPREG